jgi:glutathionylspermidine synthase
MTPDYRPQDFYRQGAPRVSFSLNRKRQIIDQYVDELHDMQLDMIDQAVDRSDLRQARDVINYIRSL